MRSGIVLAVALCASLTASSTTAGGFFGHGFGGHFHPFHRFHHYDSTYGYLAAGLLIGFWIHDYLQERRAAQDPYRRVWATPVPHHAPHTLPPSLQIPSSEFDRYYLVDRDGSCWLVERRHDGSKLRTPRPQDDC